MVTKSALTITPITVPVTSMCFRTLGIFTSYHAASSVGCPTRRGIPWGSRLALQHPRVSMASRSGIDQHQSPATYLSCRVKEFDIFSPDTRPGRHTLRATFLREVCLSGNGGNHQGLLI